MSSQTVRLIEGTEIVEWIRRPGVQGYRYRANFSAIWFMILVGVGCAALAFVLANRSGLTELVHKAAFTLLGATGVIAIAIALRWTAFCTRAYLAVGPEALLIGRGPRAYLVPNSRLVRSAIRMDQIQRGIVTSALPIEIGDYNTLIHLVGPFASLDGVKRFIADILGVLVQNEGDGDADTDADASVHVDGAPDEEDP
ncbi:MAG: hypothetical protein H6698_08915 [Myxococcales bacterium]|nr:hypothetical protein [Myxococcales bacterium]MCB9534406.1 hypothetical protein [Myxococcales bacterium]